VTGRPYTLLFNGSVKSSGAVGLALSGGPRPMAQTAFPGLRAITAPLKVTQSEGNLVNELDGANPTALLISAIEKRVATKDDEFYLGVLRHGQLWQLHHILAGGPSRGTMALETETAPVEGTSVQLFHRLSSGDIASPAPLFPKNALAFVVVAAAPSMQEGGGDDDGDVLVLEDTFVAASENGFMLSRGGEPTWTCIAPRAQARLTW